MQSLRYKENRKAVSERRQEQPRATLYRKILISWSSGLGIRIFLYQIKGNQESLIVKEKYRNSDMQSFRYKENPQGVSERRQEQPSATLCRKIIISWSPGFGILICLYQIKGNQAGLIVKEKYRNSEMQSLRYKENREGVSERLQEQPSATLYRKILISWSSGLGILNFLYQIKGNYASWIVKEKYRNSEMQSLRYKKNRKTLSERRQEQ